MRYYQFDLDRFPSIEAKTLDILTGIDTAIWIYETRAGKMGGDVLLFDEDGLITMQRVTAPAN